MAKAEVTIKLKFDFDEQDFGNGNLTHLEIEKEIKKTYREILENEAEFPDEINVIIKN